MSAALELQLCCLCCHVVSFFRDPEQARGPLPARRLSSSQRLSAARRAERWPRFLRTRVVYATSARRFATQRANQSCVFVVAALANHSAGVNYRAYRAICTTKRPQKCHYISIYSSLTGGQVSVANCLNVFASSRPKWV